MKADNKISVSVSSQESAPKIKSATLIDIVVPNNYSYRLSSTPLRKKHNRLFTGDNLLVMTHLINEGYEKKFDLIYIDPPYFSQREYTHFSKTRGGEKNQIAYSDKWKDINEYLEMLHPRLLLMRRLLKDDGSIFVHLDWHVSHYVKILLDNIFGYDNFRNEIVWCYFGPGSPKMKQFNREHQNIFWYSKSSKNWRFYKESVRVPYKKTTMQKINSRKNGFRGSVHDFSKGKIPEDWWSDIPLAQRYRHEVVGFETQKPKKLLERIIIATTVEGDLVGDFFAGSGTTAVAAEENERKWVTCDNSNLSIKLARSRLGDMIKKPFIVEKIILKKELNRKIEIKSKSKLDNGVLNLLKS